MNDILSLDVHQLRAALIQAEYERDRMRVVYQAAKAWRVGRDRDVVGTAPSGGQRSATGVALIDAIDAARLGEGEK